jgi:hypothetical protein
MRLARVVAAGLVAGALSGFVGALLRPRRRTLPSAGVADPSAAVDGGSPA